MEQFDLFPEGDKKVKEKEENFGEKVDTILENICTNCGRI